MSTITIHTDTLRGHAAPLYHQYPQQSQPQPAYIEITEDGDVSAGYSGEIGGAVPMAVWHHRTLRVPVHAAMRWESVGCVDGPLATSGLPLLKHSGARRAASRTSRLALAC